MIYPNLTAMSEERGQRLLFLLLLGTVLCWLVAFTAVGYPWSMVGLTMTDSLKYFWMAQGLHSGAVDSLAQHGQTILSETRFPPGYPLFLSLFGPDPSPAGMRAANFGQWLTVLLALATSWRFYRQSLGAGAAAIAAFAFTLAMPWVYPWSFDLISEPLFVALLLTICVLAEQRPSARSSYFMCLLFGALCLTRSIGYPLLLVLAYWLWNGSRSIPRVLAGMAIAMGPIVAWKIFQWTQGRAGADSYLLWLLWELRGLANNPWDILWPQWSKFAAAFTPMGWHQGVRIALGSALLICALIQIAPRARKKDSTALIAATLFLVLLSWPYPLHFDRLVAPLAPFILSYALLPFAASCRASQPPSAQSPVAAASAGKAIAAVVLAVAALATTWGLAIAPMVASSRAQLPEFERSFLRSTLATMNTEQAPKTIERLARTLDVASQLDTLVPPGECIYTTSPDFIALRSTRKLIDSPVPFNWSRGPCKYALAISIWDGSHVGGPGYPMQQGGLSYRMVAQWKLPSDTDAIGTLMRQPAAEPGKAD
ncbi:MAG: hypothetical protein AB7E72_01785 [Lysobacterales bacterium]